MICQRFFRGARSLLPIAALLSALVTCKQTDGGAAKDPNQAANLPRAVHGAITHGTSHGTNHAPVVGAIIAARMDANPNMRWVFTADSLRRYRIENPGIGSLSLSVGCPASTRQPARSLKFAGIDVKPGLDTAIDMTVDTAICDDTVTTGYTVTAKPPPPKPVMPGSLMSPDETMKSQAATYPGHEDAEIYSEALKQTGEPPGTKLFVYRTTRTYCYGAKCDGDLEERFHFAPAVILSTFASFKAIRNERIDLRPQLSSRTYTELVGDSVMRFVKLKSGITGERPDVNGMGAYWQAFHDAFPSAGALITLGPVAYSTHHRQAMVEISRTTRDGFSIVIFVFNKASDGTWRAAAQL